MARKREIYTPLYRDPKPSSGSRIRIPQPAYKPIQLYSRDAVKREDLRTNDPDLVLHHRGLRQPKLGDDPQEARAVQYVRGSLPERILYKELLRFGFSDSSDFDFQSSQSGGRNELGGLVADFLFPNYWLVIQVQSYWHGTHMQEERDKQQAQILADMGYFVEYIADKVILDVYLIEDKIRRIFGLVGFRGANLVQSYIDIEETGELEAAEDFWDPVMVKLNYMEGMIDAWLE